VQRIFVKKNVPESPDFEDLKKFPEIAIFGQ
jgi:hypothetical protein